MEYHIDSMQAFYADIVASVLEGDSVTRRGQDTVEVLNASIILSDPTAALATGIGRKLNSQIAAVEALQLLGGFTDPALMVRAGSHFINFQDGGNFWGGYGQRTRAQVPQMLARFRNDVTTRQAQVTLWDPVYDLFVEDSRDYPCTTSIQLMVSAHGELDCHVHMRSNDAWLGLPYDVFQFTQFQLACAAFLGIPAGTYYHHATTLHIYERNMPEIEAFLSSIRTYTPFTLGSLLTDGTFNWDLFTRTLRDYVRTGIKSPVEGLLNEEVLAWYQKNIPL